VSRPVNVSIFILSGDICRVAPARNAREWDGARRPERHSVRECHAPSHLIRQELLPPQTPSRRGLITDPLAGQNRKRTNEQVSATETSLDSLLHQPGNPTLANRSQQRLKPSRLVSTSLLGALPHLQILLHCASRGVSSSKSNLAPRGESISLRVSPNQLWAAVGR